MDTYTDIYGPSYAPSHYEYKYVRDSKKDMPKSEYTKFGDKIPKNDSDIFARIHIDGRNIIIIGRFIRSESDNSLGIVTAAGVYGAIGISVNYDDIWKYN